MTLPFEVNHRQSPPTASNTVAMANPVSPVRLQRAAIVNVMAVISGLGGSVAKLALNLDK
jgi:hypothetical protein